MKKLAVCFLQTYNSVLNIVVIWLVLRQIIMMVLLVQCYPESLPPIIMYYVHVLFTRTLRCVWTGHCM